MKVENSTPQTHFIEDKLQQSTKHFWNVLQKVSPILQVIESPNCPALPKVKATSESHISPNFANSSLLRPKGKTINSLPKRPWRMNLVYPILFQDRGNTRPLIRGLSNTRGLEFLPQSFQPQITFLMGGIVTDPILPKFLGENSFRCVFLFSSWVVCFEGISFSVIGNSSEEGFKKVFFWDRVAGIGKIYTTCKWYAFFLKFID